MSVYRGLTTPFEEQSDDLRYGSSGSKVLIRAWFTTGHPAAAHPKSALQARAYAVREQITQAS